MNTFYRGKNILVTGDTGFKGSLLCLALSQFGANVYGYGLPMEEDESLNSILNMNQLIHHTDGDIRDINNLERIFKIAKPEIVFHLAAQPLVRKSYADPVYTYETNVLGTLYICECVRRSNSVKSFVNVTTDKVYANDENTIAFTEDMPLNGRDPYSNSKSCSELITSSYNTSFFKNKMIPVSTVRAGNVIGGGDFALDRIVPDCYRAATKSEKIVIRNPYSVRPYQHVYEALRVYMMIAEKQYKNYEFSGVYNVGPDFESCLETGKLADMFCRFWGENQEWINEYDGGPFESKVLRLDNTKLKQTFGWTSHINITEAIRMTVEWYKNYNSGEDMRKYTIKEMKELHLI